MIKVNNSDRSENEEGIAVLKEIVYKRMKEKLVAEDALKYMILNQEEQSGIFFHAYKLCNTGTFKNRTTADFHGRCNSCSYAAEKHV